MADHLRKQIRDALLAALTGQGNWGARAYASRRHPLTAGELPAVCIYTLSEDSGRDSAQNLRRVLEVAVEAVTQINDTLDDTLDVMCRDIEAVIGGNPTLGGLAYEAQLVRTQIALQPAKGAQIETGSAVMTYRVTYRTAVSNATSNTR